MGKGNFFKKNIKKRKKERKERGIKQRISDQKKKVEEKVHHVVNAITAPQKPPEHEQEVKIEEEKETEPIIEEPVIETKPEPIKEKPPEPKIEHLIFDTSIITLIMLDNKQVIESIQSFSEKETKFLTIDSVINEFVENERLIYNRILTFDQVATKLKQLGNFQYYRFDDSSDIAKRAISLFEAEKYIDDSDILEEKKLSKTDCLLVELLMDKSVVLVTNNTLLNDATKNEASERDVFVRIFDPLKL